MDTTRSDGERGIDSKTAKRSREVDRACSLLADGRRRALLGTLIERDGETFHFSDLVSAIARRRDDSWRAVAIALHHCHLPKAAEAGVVEYDRRSGDVRYRGHDVVEAVFGN